MRYGLLQQKNKRQLDRDSRQQHDSERIDESDVLEVSEDSQAP